MTNVVTEPAGIEDQRRASDPVASVWVMANAGSGKTRVLTDRVLRLLLNGTRPNAILCLTFTKAAAAEMANRLHKRLGTWSVLPDAELAAELRTLLGRGATDDEMRLARQLFARTLDCAGRLRIQTIHSFCESLLKRFPLEADVPPHFGVADDATAAQLIEDARERLLATASGDEKLSPALAFVVGEIEETGFREVIAELVAERRKLRRLLANHGEDVEKLVASVWRRLGVVETDAPESLRAAFVAETPEDDLRRAAATLDTGSAADAKRAAAIRAWLAAADRDARIETEWADIFLTKNGQPRATLITQKAQKSDDAALEILEKEQARVVQFCERLKAVTVARGTAALLRLGKALLDIYEEEKAARALLDYDDLIFKTGALLRRSGQAAWVLFKLDGGIDHILVDEAQDTSPEQWDVITALSEEFFAGHGARERQRTIFAVGDDKQSIFSFQGADPEAVSHMRAHFAARARDAGQVFRSVDLKISFRSCAAVLNAVDTIFSRAEARDGVCMNGTEIRHIPYRKSAGGMVELWKPVAPREDEAGDPWDAPLDYVGESSPPAVLARRIATTIRGWLDNGEILESRSRPIRPGDILILVRKRDAFFDEMVRALKTANVPVAGADRMILAEQLAVMDLIAVAKFALLPEDDLNLAIVLKGPLFNFDDDDLFALCHRRQGRLWTELRMRADERPHWRRAVDELSAVLDLADYVPPFEFFAGLLSVDCGRKRIVARLGHEATDAIDEFLAQALAYERQRPPTLQGFLSWFEAGTAEIKRDTEQNRDEVRVMTVHGAKGLEANIVFLPDTCGVPDGRNDPRILWTEGRDPLPLWPIRSSNDTSACAAARDSGRRAREREYRRLLYVAATRARDRLYICGWQGPTRPGGCWYDLIAPAIESDPRAVEVTLPWNETAIRLHLRQEGPPEHDALPQSIDTLISGLPRWCDQLPPEDPIPPRPLMPSRPDVEPPVRSPLDGDDAARFKRGRLIHRLLQMLPELPRHEREAAARRFLARPAHGLTAEAQDELVRETLAVLDHPEFADLFTGNGVAESPIVGRLGTRVLSGQIDRVVVARDAVFVLDYKTNRPVPRDPDDVPSVYLAQMAAYRAAVQTIYPDRQIRCCLLWTDGPRLMELPADLLDRHAPH